MHSVSALRESPSRPELNYPADLDRNLEFFSHGRVQPGYRMKGRKPFQAFADGVAPMGLGTGVNPEAA